MTILPFTPDRFTLGGSRVEVWRVGARDRDRALVEELEQTLSDDERVRAGRFRRELDRDRFIIARGSLRAILGRYLRSEPSQLRFRYGTYGKPALAEPPAGGLRFNLSHSEDLTLIAVARDIEVGIDIEAIRADFDIEGLARRYLSPTDVTLIESSPAKHEAFFTCWAIKEAYLKAHGAGLSAPPDLLDDRKRECTHRLIPIPGYAAVVAVWRV